MTDPMPQMYNHCVNVYEAMEKESKVVIEGDGPPRRIWVGFLTKLINEDLGLAVPYYSAVRNNLKRMGCIDQLQRGGGTHPSTWELIKNPTEDLFNTKGQIRTNSKTAQLENQVKDLNNRVKVLEDLIKGVA